MTTMNPIHRPKEDKVKLLWRMALSNPTIHTCLKMFQNQEFDFEEALLTIIILLFASNEEMVKEREKAIMNSTHETLIINMSEADGTEVSQMYRRRK